MCTIAIMRLEFEARNLSLKESTSLLATCVLVIRSREKRVIKTLVSRCKTADIADVLPLGVEFSSCCNRFCSYLSFTRENKKN